MSWKDKSDGWYVAFPDFSSKEIIAENEDGIKCIEEAKKKGYKDPVIGFHSKIPMFPSCWNISDGKNNKKTL